MANRFEGFEQNSSKRGVRVEGKRITIHLSRESRRVLAGPDNVPKVERSDEYQLLFVCDLCSASISVDNVIQLLDCTFHRTPCSSRVIDEIVEEQLNHPGTFNAVTMARVYALRDELKRERGGFLRRMFDKLLGRQ